MRNHDRTVVGARAHKYILADLQATPKEIISLAKKDRLGALQHPNCPPDLWFELAWDRPLEAIQSPAGALHMLEYPERWLALEKSSAGEWIRRVEFSVSDQDLRLFAADCVEHVLPIFQAYPYLPDDCQNAPEALVTAARRMASGQLSASEWQQFMDLANYTCAQTKRWRAAHSIAKGARNLLQKERLDIKPMSEFPHGALSGAALAVMFSELPDEEAQPGLYLGDYTEAYTRERVWQWRRILSYVLPAKPADEVGAYNISDDEIKAALRKGNYRQDYAAQLLGIPAGTLQSMIVRRGIVLEESPKYREPRPIRQGPATPRRVVSNEEIEAALRETGYHQGRAAELLGLNKPTLSMMIMNRGIQIDRAARHEVLSNALTKYHLTKSEIEAALREHNYNKARTAASLGMQPPTLERLIEQTGAEMADRDTRRAMRQDARERARRRSDPDEVGAYDISDDEIKAALRQANYHQAYAAELLGLKAPTLNRMIASRGIVLEESPKYREPKPLRQAPKTPRKIFSDEEIVAALRETGYHQGMTAELLGIAQSTLSMMIERRGIPIDRGVKHETLSSSFQKYHLTKHEIEAALRDHSYNIARTAATLGMPPPTLQRLIVQAGAEVADRETRRAMRQDARERARKPHDPEEIGARYYSRRSR